MPTVSRKKSFSLAGFFNSLKDGRLSFTRTTFFNCFFFFGGGGGGCVCVLCRSSKVFNVVGPKHVLFWAYLQRFCFLSALLMSNYGNDTDRCIVFAPYIPSCMYTNMSLFHGAQYFHSLFVVEMQKVRATANLQCLWRLSPSVFLRPHTSNMACSLCSLFVISS